MKIYTSLCIVMVFMLLLAEVNMKNFNFN